MSDDDLLDVYRGINYDSAILFYQKYLIFNESSSIFVKNVLRFFCNDIAILKNVLSNAGTASKLLSTRSQPVYL